MYVEGKEHRTRQLKHSKDHLGDHPYTAKCYYLLGKVYEKQHSYDAAITNYDQALQCYYRVDYHSSKNFLTYVENRQGYLIGTHASPESALLLRRSPLRSYPNQIRLSDSAGFDRIWSDSVGFGRIRSDLVRFGRVQSDSVG